MSLLHASESTPCPKKGVTCKDLVMALNLFRFRDSLENLLKVMDPLPRKMLRCQSNSRVHIISGALLIPLTCTLF